MADKTKIIRDSRGRQYEVPEEATQEDINNYLSVAPPEEPYNFWNPPHGLIRTGARDLYQGFKDLGTAFVSPTMGPETAMRGAHEAITGAGKMALPAVALPALMNPGTSLLALGGGYLGGKGLQAGAKMMGLSPEAQDLWGDIGNIAGGALGMGIKPNVGGALRGMRYGGITNPPSMGDVPEDIGGILGGLGGMLKGRPFEGAYTGRVLGRTIPRLYGAAKYGAQGFFRPGSIGPTEAAAASGMGMPKTEMPPVKPPKPSFTMKQMREHWMEGSYSDIPELNDALYQRDLMEQHGLTKERAETEFRTAQSIKAKQRAKEANEVTAEAERKRVAEEKEAERLRKEAEKKRLAEEKEAADTFAAQQKAINAAARSALPRGKPSTPPVARPDPALFNPPPVKFRRAEPEPERFNVPLTPGKTLPGPVAAPVTKRFQVPLTPGKRLPGAETPEVTETETPQVQPQAQVQPQVQPQKSAADLLNERMTGLLPRVSTRSGFRYKANIKQLIESGDIEGATAAVDQLERLAVAREKNR